LGLKPVSTHVINYGSPKSVTKTHHEPNTLVTAKLIHLYFDKKRRKQ